MESTLLLHLAVVLTTDTRHHNSISAAVKTANERKAQLRAQKELERHNKELEKQISGSGVIVDFAEKL